jgi:glycosyltransferase involved in cell wall biosynthesis
MAAEPLRILAVSHAYPRRSSSGHGVFIHRLHRAMMDLGARVDVLQSAPWTPPWPLREVFRPWRDEHARRDDLLDNLDGIRIHHPLVVSPRPSRVFAQDPWQREWKALARYCKRNPDLARAHVVLGHFLVPDGVHALALGRAMGLPVAAVAWGDDVHAWPAGSPELRAKLVEVLTGIDVPVACSHRLASDANSWLSTPRSDWQVIYGGVDLDACSPARDRRRARALTLAPIAGIDVEKSRVLLMVGQAVRAKGYLELLEAWGAVLERTPDWHLVMIGFDGDIDIPSVLSQRGLSDRAHWIGVQPTERMPDFMRAADAFVLPSHNEGLSLSVLEALATGIPTVTTDVGGHAEVIRSPDEGWLIPPRDVEALRGALLEVTTNADERTKRGTAGRRAAQRIGTPADNAARLLSLLTEMHAKHPRSAVAAS